MLVALIVIVVWRTERKVVFHLLRRLYYEEYSISFPPLLCLVWLRYYSIMGDVEKESEQSFLADRRRKIKKSRERQKRKEMRH